MARQHVESYQVDPDRVRGLQEAIAQLSVGAKRHGLGPIETKVLEVGERSAGLELSTPTPALGEYRPLARIEHLKSGKVSITPLSRKWIDFAEIRSERSAQKCDACGVRRKRRLTYLLQGPSGQVQVGSSCLAGYVGESDPRKALHQADVYAKARELVEEAVVDVDEAGERQQTASTVPTVEVFLGHVAAVVREEGRFVPMSEAPVGENAATATLAIANFRLEQTGETDSAGEANWIPVTPEDRAQVAELTDSYKASIDSKGDPSGYERRLRNLLDKDFAWPSYQGILATLFFARPDPAELSGRNREEGAARKEWLGEVGEKVNLDVTVERIHKPVESRYGEQVPHRLVDDQGHLLTWFATNRNLGVGTRWRLEGEIGSRRKFRRDYITVVTKCRVTPL